LVTVQKNSLAGRCGTFSVMKVKLLSSMFLAKKEKTSMKALRLNLYVKMASLYGRILIPNLFLIKMVSFWEL